MLDLIQCLRRRDAVPKARNADEFFDLLFALEMESPLSGAAAECPYFVLMPPVLKTQDTWSHLSSELGLPDEAVGRLLRNGFMPLDCELFEKKTATDLCEPFSFATGHTLIDTDYGIMLIPRPAGMGNFGLDRAMLERLQRVDDHYKTSPSDMFSVGGIRADFILNGRISNPPKVPEYSVSSRSQLDDIIDDISLKAKPFPVEVWFRGQPNDYHVGDLSRDAIDGTCPWRHVRDTSLVPSLYRRGLVWDGTEMPNEYCRVLNELSMYTLWMGARLQMQPFTTRKPGEPPLEKLNDAWGNYTGGPTFTSTDDEGTTVSIRDYHPAFHGLQQSFFLQHYGLPSNILDITSSVDVGLFFAQHAVDENRFVRVERPDHGPVLYVFLLMPGVDRFIDSSSLSEHYHLERPTRQACGLMCGASFITRNFFARFLAIKIHLTGSIAFDDELTAPHLFPSRGEDKFLDDMLSFKEDAEITLSPFVLNGADKSRR